MPRKAFLKDLEEAAQPSRFERIVSVRAGEDAGTVRFTCRSDILMEGEVVIEALIPGQSFLLFVVVINAHRQAEVADYPNDHQFLLYTTGEQIPSSVGAILERIQPPLGGCHLSRMLDTVSSAIGHALSNDISDPGAALDSDCDADLEAEA